MRSARKRKAEGIDLPEEPSGLPVPENHDAAVLRQPAILSDLRESKFRHLKRTLAVPESTEPVSVREACEQCCACFPFHYHVDLAVSVTLLSLCIKMQGGFSTNSCT